ncbi:MAG: hypothetical protein AB7H96_15390 [Vicinamibacterales bacterium]
MTRYIAVLLALSLTCIGCSSAPADATLRDSFARQLAANRFVSGFARNGDTMTFTGPAPDGTPAAWTIHIDSSAVEKRDNEKQPYKGTVLSSWSVNGEMVRITGGDSNLPIELTSNGLSQDCWAFWDAATGSWSWE